MKDNTKHPEKPNHLLDKAHQIFIDGTKDYAIIMLDPQGKITTWNAGAERMKGYKSNEILGQHFSCLYTAEAIAKKHPDKELQIAKEMGRYEEEGWRVRKDGSTFWANVIITPIYDETGNLIAYGKITRDLTERKKIDLMKTEFISVVSHELRTPLTSIKGSLGLILTGALGEIPDQVNKFLKVASQNCDRLVRLINDILDIEKIEAGKMSFDLVPVDIGKLIMDVADSNKMYAKQYHVHLHTEGVIENIIVLGDSDRLMQALTNLISNAVKFSPLYDKVTIKMEQHNDMIRVIIKDNGPGVPKEFHQSIFEKFSQADTSTMRQKGGTGLGLAISKAIIETHGGILNFVDSEHGGSTFYFELPVLKQD